MYEIISGGRFKKDLKRFKNNPEKIQKISVCVELLSQGGVENIPPEMKPHNSWVYTKTVGNVIYNLIC